MKTSGNKKGNAIAEPITIIIFVIVFAVVSLITYGIYKDLDSDISIDPDMNNMTKLIISDASDSHAAIWDNMLFFAIILMWAVSIALAFIADSHPVFLIFSFLALMFLVFAAVQVSQLYTEDVIDDADLGVYAADFPKINWFMQHIAIMVVSMFASIGLVLFAKVKSS